MGLNRKQIDRFAEAGSDAREVVHGAALVFLGTDKEPANKPFTATLGRLVKRREYDNGGFRPDTDSVIRVRKAVKIGFYVGAKIRVVSTGQVLRIEEIDPRPASNETEIQLVQST